MHNIYIVLNLCNESQAVVHINDNCKIKVSKIIKK